MQESPPRLRKVRITLMLEDQDDLAEFVHDWMTQDLEATEVLVSIEFPEGLKGEPSDDALYEDGYVDPDLPTE